MSVAPQPAGGPSPGEEPPLLEVRGLRVSFGGAGSSRGGEPVEAVRGVSFDLRQGEVLALVGESGSGKSVCALSLLGLTRFEGALVKGSARFEGEELIGASEAKLRRVRGAKAAMVFQDPMSSLNPVMRVGEQIAEQIRAHEQGVSKADALARAGELLERLRIPQAYERVRSYPHELSGGMRQRVMIAMALSLGPKLLLADEPTTALDVTVQRQILDQLDELRREEEMGVLLITHDFAVVAQIADRVAVMRSGQIVEQGSVERVLDEPKHPYTRELLQALEPAPRRGRPPAPPAGVFAAPQAGLGAPADEPLLRVEGLTVAYRRAAVPALAGVAIEVRRGETLAIVGESGCGKTTLLRAIARLVDPKAGAIVFDGRDLAQVKGRGLAPLRASLGLVFQDPQASLNPRRRVGRTLSRALRARGVPRSEAQSGAMRLLERVGLSAAHASRFPHELSGGERQRAAIARALAGEPKLVLLDEPVSSLDAALRRGVIDLLGDVQAQLACGYVLVSHDLSIVAGIADRIAVMRGGEIVEAGDAEEVLERPRHPYTQALLQARPKVRSAGWSAPRTP